MRLCRVLSTLHDWFENSRVQEGDQNLTVHLGMLARLCHGKVLLNLEKHYCEFFSDKCLQKYYFMK